MTAIKRAVLYPPFIFICGLWKISEFITIIILESAVVWLAQRLDGGPIVNSKKWYKSKTIWLNNGLIALGVAILELPELRTYILSLSPMTQAAFIIILGGLGGLLRFVTDKAVEW